MDRTPQDSIVGDPLEHLKAVVTEKTRKRQTGSGAFADGISTDLESAPEVPTNVSVAQVFGNVIHTTQGRVTWTDNSAGVLKHRVYYRQLADTNWILATPTGIDAGTTQFDLKALAPKLVYEVAVRSWDQATGEESALSAIYIYDITLNTSHIYRINELVA